MVTNMVGKVLEELGIGNPSDGLGLNICAHCGQVIGASALLPDML